MSAEKIDQQILYNFLQELPSGLPISKIAVINLPRSVNLSSFVPSNIKEKSIIIDSKENDSSEIVDSLSSGLKSGNFVFLRFIGYLPKVLFDILESISKQGYFDVLKEDGTSLRRHTVASDSHVILVSERKFVESQYGNLNNLTTYVLDLEQE